MSTNVHSVQKTNRRCGPGIFQGAAGAVYTIGSGCCRLFELHGGRGSATLCHTRSSCSVTNRRNQNQRYHLFVFVSCFLFEAIILPGSSGSTKATYVYASHSVNPIQGRGAGGGKSDPSQMLNQCNGQSRTIAGCPRSNDPFFYSNLLYKIGNYFLGK